MPRNLNVKLWVFNAQAEVILALRFALLRVSDISDALLAYDTTNQVSSRLSGVLASVIAAATAAIAEAQTQVRGAPAYVSNGLAAAAALPASAIDSLGNFVQGAAASAAPILTSRSGRNLRIAYESMLNVHVTLTAAVQVSRLPGCLWANVSMPEMMCTSSPLATPLSTLQRGSQQAGDALSSLTAGGVGDAVAYATEELGRAMAAVTALATLPSAATESLALARGALQVWGPFFLGVGCGLQVWGVGCGLQVWGVGRGLKVCPVVQSGVPRKTDTRVITVLCILVTLRFPRTTGTKSPHQHRYLCSGGAPQPDSELQQPRGWPRYERC